MTSWQPRRARDGVLYWLKGEPVLNFGDALSEVLLAELFVDLGARHAPVRVIGSCLHDFVVDEVLPEPLATWSWAYDASGQRRLPHLIAWGLGVREEAGLSPDRQDKIEVLSVRGPISAAELGLEGQVPLGDPALLLPALHAPVVSSEYSGRSVCIPHFHDGRGDDELREISGCDLVLRPAVAPSPASLWEFVDAVTSASFVLSASLHAAIVAAAYGRPFAFWNPGAIDLPLKWQDFSTSVGFDARFVASLAEGEVEYRENIAPRLSVPSMLDVVLAAPFLLRNEALLKIIRHEMLLASSGDAAGSGACWDRYIEALERRRTRFDALAAEPRLQLERVATELEAALRELAETAEEAVRRGEHITRLDEMVEDEKAAWKEADATARRLLEHQAALERHIGDLDADSDRLRSEWERHQSEWERQRAEWEQHHVELTEHAAQLQQRIDAMESSTIWRATAPIRRLGRWRRSGPGLPS
jgi:hypothetical protein